MNHRLLRLIVAALSVLVLWGCAEEDAPKADSTEWVECRVAVILPASDAGQTRWQRLTDWASGTLEKAQSGSPRGVRLVYEWYDENTVDIARCAETLAGRDDIAAVVGPFYSSHVNEAAEKLLDCGKPLFTAASSAELVRRYAESPTNKSHLWALVETDITQCEVMLSKALMYGYTNVALIAQPDIYGQTFIDWFAFQAREMGLHFSAVVQYSPERLESDMAMALESGPEMLLCVPSSVGDAQRMAEAYRKSPGVGQTRLMFADVARDPLFPSNATEGLEGISIAADPESGFQQAYMARFGEEPSNCDAQLLDAFLLIGMGAAYRLWSEPEITLNDALRAIVNYDGEQLLTVWNPTAMQSAMEMLRLGQIPGIRGASGSLDFDAKVYTNVLHTTYSWWEVYDGEFITLDYNTSDGSKRTEGNLAGWNWKNSQMQEIADGNDIDYGERADNYALIVAASSEWTNYRHQADALTVYRLLRRAGMEDDHIVLVMADDIAQNPQNPERGTVRVRPGGENVREGALIDYSLDELEPEHIIDILCGNRSELLPHVITATERDNVLVFWSGHGYYREFIWDEIDSFGRHDMADLMERLNPEGKERRYRRMLWLVETCYAGSVAEACEGYPGVLCITASNSAETSKADIFNTDLGVYMTNRFTSTLEDEMTNDIGVSMRDLYYRLFRNTVGSHVTVYNQEYFGNLYGCHLSEFTIPLNPQSR